MDKQALDRYLSQSDEDAHPDWFDEHPEDQVEITFPKEVVQFMTGDYESDDEVTLPLFRRLGVDEEAQFRQHARENYVVGTEIKDIYHPVWRDEARKMNKEVGGGSR